MPSSSVCSRTLLKDAHNLAVWVRFDKKNSRLSHDAKVSLLNSEIQAICKEYLSTLDESMERLKPRPNPTPRVFVEQGNDLSRVLWLLWEQ